MENAPKPNFQSQFTGKAAVDGEDFFIIDLNKLSKVNGLSTYVDHYLKDLMKAPMDIDTFIRGLPVAELMELQFDADLVIQMDNTDDDKVHPAAYHKAYKMRESLAAFVFLGMMNEGHTKEPTALDAKIGVRLVALFALNENRRRNNHPQFIEGEYRFDLDPMEIAKKILNEKAR